LGARVPIIPTSRAADSVRTRMASCVVAALYAAACPAADIVKLCGMTPDG
jgi:phosphate acetyltransferase